MLNAKWRNDSLVVILSIEKVSQSKTMVSGEIDHCPYPIRKPLTEGAATTQSMTTDTKLTDPLRSDGSYLEAQKLNLCNKRRCGDVR